MSTKQSFFKQPFFTLCFLEFFERFGYYGFVYVSIYFYIEKLGFSEAMAATLMGGFSALTYAFNAFGGIVADRILGIKRTMFVVAFLLATGYISLAFFSGISHTCIYFALALIIAGSCLFKPAPTNLIAEIYSNDHHLLDITYTYYYMSINMGSFVASSLIPYLAKNFGYTIALMVCGLGLVIGIGYNIINYSTIRHVDNSVGKTSLQKTKSLALIITLALGLIGITIVLEYDRIINWLLGIAAVCIFVYFIWQIILVKQQDIKSKMIVALILLVYAVVFFVIYQQKNTSFMLFNKDHVDLLVWGIQINPQTVPGLLDTGGIIILSPIFARMYRYLGKNDLSLPRKFSIGLFLSSFAYGTLWLACLVTSPSGKIAFAWEVLSISLFFASSELLISALGVSLMAQLVPDRLRGFSMGMWFITSALGIKLGSYVASIVASQKVSKHIVELSGVEKITSFTNYQHLFGMIFLSALVVAVIAWLLGGRLDRMLKM